MHDLGYRNWDEEARYQKTSWLHISRYGARLAWKSLWLKRLVLFSFFPAVFLAVFFFLYEQVASWPGIAEMLVPAIASVEGEDFIEVASAVQLTREEIQNPSEIPKKILQTYVNEKRPVYWSQMVYYFFARALGLVILIFGLISPRLISRDVQSRAFLLYFSRPITPFQYVLGKLVTIWLFLVLVFTLPALFSYLLGVLVSPSLAVLLSTWLLPFRILAATFLIALPTGLLALCLSSLVQEARYASFAWFAIWIVGYASYRILLATQISTAASTASLTTYTFISIYDVIHQNLQWVFGLVSFDTIKWFFLELVAISVISYLILMRRVTAPIRI